MGRRQHPKFINKMLLMRTVTTLLLWGCDWCWQMNAAEQTIILRWAAEGRVAAWMMQRLLQLRGTLGERDATAPDANGGGEGGAGGGSGVV